MTEDEEKTLVEDIENLIVQKDYRQAYRLLNQAIEEDSKLTEFHILRLRLLCVYEPNDGFTKASGSLYHLKEEEEIDEERYGEFRDIIYHRYRVFLAGSLAKLQPVMSDVSQFRNEAHLALASHFWEGKLLNSLLETALWYNANNAKASQGTQGLFGSSRNTVKPLELLTQSLKIATPQDELYPLLRVCLADVYAIHGDLANAIENYRMSLEEPQFPFALFEKFRWLWEHAYHQILAQVYFAVKSMIDDNGEIGDGLVMCLNAIDAKTALFYFTQGEVYLYTKNAEQALHAYYEFYDAPEELTNTMLQSGNFIDGVQEIAKLLPTKVSFERPLVYTTQAVVHRAEPNKLRALIALKRWDDVSQSIEQLLQENPPKVSMDELYALKEQMLEKKIEHQYELALQMADEAYRQKDWQTASAKYLFSSSSVQMTTVHRVRCVVALGQSGNELERVRLTLRQLVPSEFEKLDPADIQYFTDVVVKLDLWADAHRYITQMPLDPDKALHYTNGRSAYIAQQVTIGQAALQNQEYAVAKEVVQHLERMAVTDIDAVLFWAEWLKQEGRWHQLRSLLVPYANADERVLPLLISADLEQGYIEDASSRISPDTAPEIALQLRQMIEARATFRPYFHVVNMKGSVMVDSLRHDANAEVWNGYFAINLKEVSYTRYNLTTLRHLFDHEMADFLTALHNNPSNTAKYHFSWRTIAKNRRLKIVLLCCVEAYSEEQAVAESHDLWSLVSRLLPLQSDKTFYYEPVYLLEELLAHYEPFEMRSFYQVIRKERKSSSGDLHIMPIVASEGDKNVLLQALLDAQQDVLLDVYFQPTELMAWERNPPFAQSNSQSSATSTLDAGNLQLLELINRGAHMQRVDNYFGSYPYVMQIRLASTNSLNLGLRSIIRVEMFGQSPVDFMDAVQDTDREIALRNLRTLRAEQWGYEMSTLKGNRWRYLYALPEVLIGTRLPLPKSDGMVGMKVAQVKQAPVPKTLSDSGVVIGELLTPVQGKRQTVRLSIADRMRHVYVVGRTGTGKSSLLQRMILQDIEQGYGVIVIDPHGDLVDGVLERCPTYREQDVMLFDPSDIDYPMGFNMLDVEGDFQRNMVISDFIGLLYAIFDPQRTGMIGPRFENAVRQSMLVAMELQDGSFLEMVRMLADDKFREQAVELVTDPMVKMYWNEIAKNFRNLGEGNMMDYVTSKFARFQVSPLRNIIGQGKTTLDIERIMSEQKILLVNLSKGKIGPETSQFLGLVLIPQIFIATLKRAKLAQSERHPICLYVDEFHNLTTSSFAQMLSEARKYGLAITVANQFISQLTDPVREAIFGNVGTLLSFRVGVKDAMFLAEEYHPVYGNEDLINLPNYHLLVKSLMEGETIQRFPIRTLSDEYVVDEGRAMRIRQQSRQSYGRDHRIVERGISERLKQSPKRKHRP